MVPEAISHYRIVHKLGAGGMGEVYLAEDTRLKRQVAIKLLPQGSVGDEKARRRLIQEAQAAARLDHPNICAIYEVGEQDEACFIVMQFVEGQTLADRVKAGAVSLEESVEVAIQIADALGEAHSRGIVHRDIKPHNIMITPKGLVKVLDFGLAKLVREEALLESQADTASMMTAPGTIIGTVPYMSPEQLGGKPVDDRSDIFSLGAVLYETISGKHPFKGETAATTAANILMKEPQGLRELVPQAPPELQRIINKALAKNREDRYQRVTELFSDLREFRKTTLDQPLSARSSSWLSNRLTSALPQVVGQSTTRSVRAPLVRRRTAIIWGAFLVVAGAALIFMMKGGFGKTDAINSIAVLPFSDINRDPELEYLGDGITENLIKNLSRLPNTKVIASSSVFQFKGEQVDPATVGRRLKVDALVIGRITQRGDDLTISIELVDASDNSHIWGDVFTRKASNVFALENDIARQVSERLRVKLSGEDEARLSKQQTDNAEAYRLYLQGRYYWNKRRGGALRKAIEYFQKAIETDPNYALAHAGIAESWVLGGGISAPPGEYMMKAKAAAEDALKLDDTLVEAYLTLAKVKSEYEWRWDEAEVEFKRAIELNPNYATAYEWYAEHLMPLGRLGEATAMLKRAYDLDPLSLSITTSLGASLYYAGEYDKAIDAFNRALDMDRTFVDAHYMLGSAYVEKGMYNEAVAEFQKALETAPGFFPAIAMTGYSHAKAGRRAEAEKALKQLIDISSKRHISTYNMVIIYAGLGDVERAIDWLWKGYEARASYLIYINVSPIYKGLRPHPRFQELVKRVGLP